MTFQVRGLVAATYTPFDAQGEVNLAAIEPYAEHLQRFAVQAAFINGSTGESHSLSLEERLAMARRWSEALRGSSVRLVVHVGTNCLADARAMAAQAQSLGAAAVAALAPSYFKPRTLEALVACCEQIASAAPDLPFYFYDIPALTGVAFSMPEFLEMASKRIANLAGLKFTNPDLMAYQRCLMIEDGRFDVPWGMDECLLAALAVGAVGAVGSSYNFAAPLYQKLLAAFARGDLAAAQTEQRRSVRLIDLLARYGYAAAAKATMGLLGVDVGGPRLPYLDLTAEQRKQLETDLEQIGFSRSKTV